MERKHIADRNAPRASNMLSYRIVGFIKIHDFRHSWKVPSSPNTSKLVLGPPDWSSNIFWEWRTRFLRQWLTRLSLGVAHTIFFGSGAHDIFWVWRTQYLLGVAHTIFFGSGAHDILWVWRTRYLLGVAHTIFFCYFPWISHGSIFH